jgi:hypothetical protein
MLPSRFPDFSLKWKDNYITSIKRLRMAVVQMARMARWWEVNGVFGLLRGKHGIPDRGRSLAFEPQSIQGELIFVDTAEQFYISDGDSGGFEVLEAKHRPASSL